MLVMIYLENESGSGWDKPRVVEVDRVVSGNSGLHSKFAKVQGVQVRPEVTVPEGFQFDAISFMDCAPLERGGVTASIWFTRVR